MKHFRPADKKITLLVQSTILGGKVPFYVEFKKINSKYGTIKLVGNIQCDRICYLDIYLNIDGNAHDVFRIGLAAGSTPLDHEFKFQITPGAVIGFNSVLSVLQPKLREIMLVTPFASFQGCVDIY